MICQDEEQAEEYVAVCRFDVLLCRNNCDS